MKSFNEVCGCGGDFIREGLYPCCKTHMGDYVHVVEFIGGGGVMSTLQNSKGGLCPPIQKMSRGDFVPGDILSISLKKAHLIRLPARVSSLISMCETIPTFW